jgi:MFS family permease
MAMRVCLEGPIASALSIRFGCRAVCLVGSAIAATGIFISGFSTNIEMLLITYGVMGGESRIRCCVELEMGNSRNHISDCLSKLCHVTSVRPHDSSSFTAANNL